MKILVDVREKEEFKEGSAPGAVNIPLDDIYNQKLGPLEKVPKDTSILLFCVSGARAQVAMAILKKLGFTNVRNVGGVEDAASF